MYVVIVGGGRTGTQLARMLIRQNHEVHIVESRRDVLSRLHRDIPTEMIHEGNEIDPRVLEIAGIQRADIIAAVTTNDEDNLVICYISRNRYNVPRTIARVNNPRNAWLFNQMFHVDAAVNPSEIMSRLIEEEMSMKDMMVLAKLRRGNYSLVVEKILPGSSAIGRSILDLQLPDSSVIAALVREDKVVMPRGKTIFEVGDEIYAITDAEGEENLQNIFAGPLTTKNGR
jgi:trk system potassium uptake protein TrkA